MDYKNSTFYIFLQISIGEITSLYNLLILAYLTIEHISNINVKIQY